MRQNSKFTNNRLHNVFENADDREAFLLLDDKMLTDLEYVQVEAQISDIESTSTQVT